jgi:hypothetical protein
MPIAVGAGNVEFLISEANLPHLKPLNLGVEAVDEVQPFPRRLIKAYHVQDTQ